MDDVPRIGTITRNKAFKLSGTSFSWICGEIEKHGDSSRVFFVGTLMKEQLNAAAAKYVNPLAEKYAFALIKEQAYGMGALTDYVGGNLYIRLVNDKGIISFEIAPKHQTDKLRDVALYKEFLSPPLQGVWNLSLAEQVEFLDQNWERLNTNLSEENAEKTLKGIDACAAKRSKILFGRNR